MAGWHFTAIPKKESGEIKKRFGGMQKGWGSLPVTATIGETSWDTSIFPDARSGTYLLPLKAAVRKKEGIFNKDKISVRLVIRA